MQSPFLAATLATVIHRDRVEGAVERAAAKRAENAGEPRDLTPPITRLIVDELMRESLIGARASDPVVPVRTTRRSLLFR